MRRHPRVVEVGLGLAIVLTLGVPPAATAQTDAPGRLTVAAGPSVLDAGETVSGAGLGWRVGLGWRTTRWLTLDLELGGHRRAEEVVPLRIEERALALLGGPGAHWRLGRGRLFGRALVGAVRLDLRAASGAVVPSTATFRETHPAVEIGGGVELALRGGLGIQMAYGVRRVFARRDFHQRVLTVSAIYRVE